MKLEVNSCYVLVLFSLVSWCVICDALPNSNRSGSRPYKKKSFVSYVFLNNTVYNVAERKNACKWLKGLKHQSNLCSKRKGLPDLLYDVKERTLASCKEQFEYERWGCLAKKKFFRKIYRETAFMYSLTSASLVYSIARACAEGKLANCRCASYAKSKNPNFKWGGCGDNTKFAQSFTNNFLQLRKKDDNFLNNILKINSQIGMRTVLQKEEKKCKCHGISGACTYHTCFKRIRTFQEIAQQLKNEYHSALQVQPPDNNSHELQMQSSKLLFVETSPKFCTGTAGRRCKDADNCATLCCSREFDKTYVTSVEKCNCFWKNIDTLDLKCQTCKRMDTVWKCIN